MIEEANENLDPSEKIETFYPKPSMKRIRNIKSNLQSIAEELEKQVNDSCVSNDNQEELETMLARNPNRINTFSGINWKDPFPDPLKK